MMKNTTIWMRMGICFLFLLITHCAMAQKASVVCEKPMHDFGTINEVDGKVSHDFIIKNTGDKPIAISRINSSCGCTVPEWDKAPLRPGKETKVHVVFNPHNRSGKFNKSITVHLSGQKSNLLLFIRGKINPKPKG
jgi:hypothetical protein